MTGLLLLLVLAPFAQSERLPIKIYATADGLPNNGVNKIVRDSRGFLWFCTADGLSRFDGYGFTNYGTNEGLPHPYTNDLLETREGEFWLATNGGLVRFNPRGVPGRSVVYANDAPPNAPPMFSVVVPDDSDRRAKAITMLFQDRNGVIWCGTMKGLYRLERANDRFVLRSIEIGLPSEYPEQTFISDILEDSTGSIWIACPSGLYRRWLDGSFARYTVRNGLPGEYLHDLFIDHKGQLWVATRLNGFFSFEADATHKPPVITHAFSSKDGLPKDWVFQLFESSDHRFWVATARGLAEFFPDGDNQGRFFHSYNERNGLTHHDINALNEDLAGNLWLGSPAGAMKLARNGFTTYDQQDGFDEVDAVFEDRTGDVCVRGWVLGNGSISIFEGAKLDVMRSNLGEHVPRFGRFDGQSFDWLLPTALKDRNLGWVGEGATLQARDGQWWLGTGSGLYRFPAADDPTQLKGARALAVYGVKDGLANAQVFRLFEDSRGDMWVSTIGPTNGLARWERGKATFLNLGDAPGLPSAKEDLAHAFAEDSAGNVWIGFATGLARYRQGQFTFISNSEGLPVGGIAQMLVDRAGRLWLASSRRGLIRVDNIDSDRPTFVSYTTERGLSSNITSAITEDHRGRIYVGTGHGLDELDPVTNRIKHFTTADGLVSGPMLSAFCDRAGTVWFGTSRGVSRFVPASEESAGAPPILITNLNVGGASQRVSAFGESEMALPDLPTNQSQVQIDFVGLSFAPGEALSYQYKLEGGGKDWSPPSEQRTVNFASLAPGKYRFLVRAITSEGKASSQPAIVRFTIPPPFWQRWWFVMLTVLAVGLLVYALYRYRMQRVIELERVRTRIATDLHDDIGAGLSRVAILTEVVKQQLAGKAERSIPVLTEIADSARGLIEAMRDIVWAIAPQRDELSNVVFRVRQFASDVLEAKGVSWDFQVPPELDRIKLDPEQRRHLYLIFKEGINNIARYSECKHAWLTLALSHNQLLGEIRDDGRGFTDALIEDSSSNGHGLKNMQRRAAQVGGWVDIETQPGQGTSIRLTIPVKRAIA